MTDTPNDAIPEPEWALRAAIELLDKLYLPERQEKLRIVARALVAEREAADKAATSRERERVALLVPMVIDLIAGLQSIDGFIRKLWKHNNIDVSGSEQDTLDNIANLCTTLSAAIAKGG